MSDRPWFKLYAADVLTDAKLDAIPPEALGLVLKIWCVCHIEGKCPADPQELARKTRLPVAYVLNYESYCKSLFDLYTGSYISERMEKEKRRSEINRVNVSKRYPFVDNKDSSTIRTTTCNDKFVLPPSDYDSDNDLEALVLEISKLHPKIADPWHLSREYAGVILDAISRHDGQVLEGTKRFRASFDRWPKDKLKFAPGVERFFRQSEYLFPTSNWDEIGLSADGKWTPPQNAPPGYVPESVKRKKELAERKAQGL